MFIDHPFDRIDGFDEFGFSKSMLSRQNEYIQWLPVVNENMIRGYSCMIINNAHLVPRQFRRILVKSFPGHVIQIVDPFDIGGEDFMYVPTIVDTFSKLSKMLGFARSMFDVETRSINMKSKGYVTSIEKFRLRSFGRIDTNQYVTNDETLANLVWDRQKLMPFTKKQKLWVISNNINPVDIMVDTDKINGGNKERYSLPANSQITISASSRKRNLYCVKPNMSDIELVTELSYEDIPDRKMVHTVRPANCILLNEITYHVYQNVIFYRSPDKELTRREKYSLIKHSGNIVIVNNVK